MIYEYILFPHAVREPPLDIGGGGAGVFAWPFLFISTNEIESCIFFHFRIGWKYLFQDYYIYFNLLCG